MPKGFSTYAQRAGETAAEKVAFYSRPAESGCRLWIASTNTNGYGKVTIEGRLTLAHRAAWESVHGPIPKGMCVCHRCDNPRCVSIDHLFLGTRSDNTRDMIAKGRHGEHMRARA